MTLRVVFMGTPDFSVPTLAEILGAGHEVVTVYTQPPRPSGRGMAEMPSPVQRFAASSGIPVVHPQSLKPEAEQQRFLALQADVAVVVAYGLILPKSILLAPRLGCLNVHASALPRWRGAAPIQRAIMAGDPATAVMVMRMEEGLDTGPICLAEPVSIGADETAGQLHDRLSVLGASLLVRALAALARGSLREQPQPAEGITYAGKIDKAEARIDFAKSAAVVHRLIRGLSPFPGAWFDVTIEGRRERVKVLRAAQADGSGPPGVLLDDALTVACGSGAVRLTELQRAGKKPMTAETLLRGFSLRQGMALQ